MASAMSGAASGAMQGAAIGGPYGALAGAAIGFFAGSAEEKARAKAAQEALEAANVRNKALVAEAARGISEINRQRTTAFIKTNQSLMHYRRQASSEKSSLANQYAAADVIGKSALIATTEIDRQQDEALSQEMFNIEVVQENFNTGVDNITNSTKNQLVDATATIDKLYEGEDSMSQFMGLLNQGASMYMGGQFDRGLNNAGLGKYAWGSSANAASGQKAGSATRNFSNVLGVQ